MTCATWPIVMISATLASCSTCPQPPSLPESGTYEVTNADELPVTVTQVEIVGSNLRIEFVDENGMDQFIEYRIDTL